jgi:cyclophilin family peptidyl-prolyl cis-trans isomerase
LSRVQARQPLRYDLPSEARVTAMRVASVLLVLLLTPLGSPAQSTDTNLSPRVRVFTTAGSFVIELDRGRAPLTVEAFMGYVTSGFYNGTIFHRVVPGFIAQAGGYTADFQPKPTTGTVVNESGNGLSNLRGTVGFARTNEPHSGTSQFYINLADNVDLNPRPTRWGYAVFGKVVEGMEVVDDIGHRPTGAGGPFDRNVPVATITIESIQILQ